MVLIEFKFVKITIVVPNIVLGKTHLVLIEGVSKRSKDCLQGRNDNNVKVILPGKDAVCSKDGRVSKELRPGDYVAVQINAASSQVLKGKCFEHQLYHYFFCVLYC